MTVYVVQEMKGRDLSDAARYGDLQLILPADHVDNDPMLLETKEIIGSKLRKYKFEDYLLFSGDPAYIAIASITVNHLASTSSYFWHPNDWQENNKLKPLKWKFRALKWDRQEQKYIEQLIGEYSVGKYV
jgi:hypothetical protein|tara:strand:+ start:1515 stop:1904 length:390 start_codon:yes stop_codon:yes gene_type:complete